MPTEPTGRQVHCRGVTAPNPTGEDCPEWYRTAFLDPEGNVYIPAAVAGPEEFLAAIAGLDNANLFIHDGHPFVSTEWLARMVPSRADLCVMIRDKVRDVLATKPEDSPATSTCTPQTEG